MTRCLFKLSQYHDARKSAEEAIKIYPEDKCLREDYLNTLVALDDYAKCIDVAMQGLLIDPYCSEWKFFMAEGYELLDQYDEAENIYKRLLDNAPWDGLLHEKIARCLCGKGLINDAIPILRRGMQVAPEHSGCYYELANAYTALDQQGKALKVARKAFKLFSATEGCAYATLGAALYNSDDDEKAMEVLKEGLLLYPDEDTILELIDDIEDEF